MDKLKGGERHTEPCVDEITSMCTPFSLSAIVGGAPGRLESNRRGAAAVGVETGKHGMQRAGGGRRGERTSQTPTGGVDSVQLRRALQRYAVPQARGCGRTQPRHPSAEKRTV